MHSTNFTWCRMLPKNCENCKKKPTVFFSMKRTKDVQIASVFDVKPRQYNSSQSLFCRILFVTLVPFLYSLSLSPSLFFSILLVVSISFLHIKLRLRSKLTQHFKHKLNKYPICNALNTKIWCCK